MEGRKTRPITFNIKDRGRVHTGQDRSNVNYEAWIDLINSPKTQEMIATGSMLGYYGHQIRMLFGINPPETAIVAGQQINISPAIRTIEMSCDKNGNLTHRQEFLNTPEGEHALRQYKARVGGFSAATDFKMHGGMVIPTEAWGMDYVLQPNYALNVGDGMLDSMGVSNPLIKSTVELSVLQMYDSIHSANYADYVAQENLQRAIDAENQLLEFKAKKEKRLQLQKTKQENMFDSALCPTVSLDEYMEHNQAFLGDSVVLQVEPKEAVKEDKKPRIGHFGWL